jgi:mannose-6-phosphate isomerase-like protein (cupin superfamily)
LKCSRLFTLETDMDRSLPSSAAWSIRIIAGVVLVAASGMRPSGQAPVGAAQRPPARQNAPLIVMSPKAASPGWSGVHRPHTKLVDVLARHKGHADWAETIVDDESLNAQWISMGPGHKTPRRMNGDTREWWVVQSGTLRFTIEGRDEPIVATKGVMVQVPYRTLYQIENIGAEPALRFEVNVTRARKLYPLDETAVPMSGFQYVKTRVDGGRGVLDAQNRQVVDFGKVVSGEERGGAFVTDDRSFANIILGRYQPPQPGNKGHYHEEGGEFWLIMLGHIRYKIEGLDQFEAEEGDVVYVPRQTWHLASNGGKEGERSCRLAMNGFPYQAHMYESD